MVERNTILKIIKYKTVIIKQDDIELYCYFGVNYGFFHKFQKKMTGKKSSDLSVVQNKGWVSDTKIRNRRGMKRT